MRRFFFFSLIFLAGSVAAAPVWQTILSDANKRIELDSTSILRQGESVEATGRVILTRPLIDHKTGAQYRIIEAATRYHCDRKSASTLKRIYKKNENEILREEAINVVELPVRTGTLDDKVLTEVCRFQDPRPPKVATAQKTAQTPAATAPKTPATSTTPAIPQNQNPQNPKNPPPPVTVTSAASNATVNAEKVSELREKPTLETDETAEPAKDIRPHFANPKRTRAQARREAAARKKLEEQRQAQAQQDIAELQTVAGKLKAANEKLLAKERQKKITRKPAVKKASAQKPATAQKATVKNDMWHKKVAHNVAKKQSASSKLEKMPMPTKSAFLPKAPELPKMQIPQAPKVISAKVNNSANTAKKPSRAAISEKTFTDWSYGGALGPSHWADLRPEYRICRDGLRQSPIDIRGSIKGDLPKIVPHYQTSPFRLVDAGYTLRVVVENGGYLELDGEEWRLQSLEFRRPGEEMVQGIRSDMSLHLIHQAASGQTLILAVPLEVGAENSAIQSLWNALPLERNETVNTTQSIDFKEFLPSSLAYYTYMGSLTAPPCTENVQWVILKSHRTASAEQMQSFSFLYPDNARPLQTDNARIVKESR